MNLTIEKDNKILSVKIKLNSSVAMVLIKDEELVARTINKETHLETIDDTINFTIDNESVKPLGIIRDIVYSNKHLLIYNPNNNTIIMLPNIMDTFGIFDLYSLEVNGLVLGTTLHKRNDNVDTISIGHKFPYSEVKDENDSSRVILDVTKLDKIKINTIALNIPGLIGTANLKYPVYIHTVNNGTIKYDNSYVGLGLEIEFGEDEEVLLNDVINSSIMLGTDVKNIRSKHVAVNKDVLKKFKKMYIVE